MVKTMKIIATPIRASSWRPVAVASSITLKYLRVIRELGYRFEAFCRWPRLGLDRAMPRQG